MHSDSKREDLRLLLAAAIPQGRIATLTGVSLRTISRIAREPVEPTAPHSGGKPRRAEPGRPTVVGPYRKYVAETLAAEPRLKRREVLRRLRRRQVGAVPLVRHLRPSAVRPICRLRGLAGEFSHHDFGEVQVAWAGGLRQRVLLFGSRLKHSRFSLVTRVPDQHVQTRVRTLGTHFEDSGWLPLMAVFDRPKTIMIRSDRRTGSVLDWNPTFAEVTTRLGVAVEVCWPYRASQKGSVENLVGPVKRSLFKRRQLFDEEDFDR